MDRLLIAFQGPLHSCSILICNHKPAGRRCVLSSPSKMGEPGLPEGKGLSPSLDGRCQKGVWTPASPLPPALHLLTSVTIADLHPHKSPSRTLTKVSCVLLRACSLEYTSLNQTLSSREVLALFPKVLVYSNSEIYSNCTSQKKVSWILWAFYQIRMI